jgi:hypothetical protein
VDFYTVFDSTVVSYSARTDETTTVLNLPFAPNSLACSCGFLVAGGQQGELAVKDMERKRLITGANHQIRGSVNNALHIAKLPSGKPRPQTACTASVTTMWCVQVT